MNSLVGYGSSSDSDSEEEITETTGVTLTNGSSTHLPSSSTPAPTSSAPAPTSISFTIPDRVSADNLDKTLDISDEEDNYVPKQTTSKQPISKPPVVSHQHPAPAPQIRNLTEVIEKAQIVTVERENLQTGDGVIANFLPKPKRNTVHELELEQLHKSKRMKRDKKKIFAFNLEDFMNDEEEVEKPKPKRPVSAKGTSGLFSILPQPTNCKIGTKSTKSVISNKATLLKPRTLKPKPPQNNSLPAEEADNDDTDKTESDFFSFGRSEKVSEEILKAAKSVKLDQFKPKQVSSAPATLKVQGELLSIDAITTPQEPVYAETTQHPALNDLGDVPAEFRDLAFNSTDIIDVNQVIQSTDEWALKNLDYSDDKPQSSGKCPLKGQTKRKNQINYLAWQAKERESELKKQWSNNKANRFATQSKYGFR